MELLTWDMVHESTIINGVKVFQPIISRYRQIIKDGLPKSVNLVQSKKVAVIGGGMAGLVATDLLSNAGYDVTIFEAANRIGGRIHTVKFPDGDLSEAGAMRLLDDYQLVFDYLEKLGLQKHPFINHDPNGQDWIFVNGIKVRRADYLKEPDCLMFNTVGTERGKTAEQLWDEALAPVLALVDWKKGLDTPENWRTVVDRYGHHSVYSFLIEEAKYSPGAIEMIVVMLFLEARMDLSMLQQLVETIDHRPDAKYYGIDGGTAELPSTLLRLVTAPNKSTDENIVRIPAKIKYSAFVRALEQNHAQDQVTVRWMELETNCLNNGMPNSSGNDQIYYPQNPQLLSEVFDYAIVTCTPPAIRRIEFTPMLPAETRKALRELNFSASTKIFLQFKEKFWLRDGFSHGSSLTDSAIRAVYYPSTDASNIVIASYTWATDAQGWDSLSPQQRVDQALNDLVKLHGEYIRDLCVAGQSYSWLLDNFSMGEAAMIFPEQVTLQAQLAKPVANIYFAGDTLSFKVAWIEGAIESGMRAALELVKLPPLGQIGILDCTLRDGGYLNNWSFTREQAKQLARLSAAAGVDVIEIGYRNGPGGDATHSGESGRSPDDYISDLRSVIPSTTKVSVMFHDNLVTMDDFKTMKGLGVDLVRCTLPPGKTDADALKHSFALLDYARSIDLETGANITYTTEYSLDDLVKTIRLAIDHKVTYICLADSNGAMTPVDIQETFAYIRQYISLHNTNVRFGFHNHNMMGLAVTNALVAVNEAVSLVDASYRGMGRSAGNVPIESFVGILNRDGVPRCAVDQLKALHVAQYLESNVPQSVPIPTVLNTAFGVYDFNELQSMLFTNASREFGVDTLDLLAYVNSQKVDRRLLNQEKVNYFAAELKKCEKKDGQVE